MEQLILVDKNNKQIGAGEKMEVHRNGNLHRAFSIFIFNSRGELMLQKRALSKYHSGGLWTNACCSHPRIGEEVAEAAHRRLKEEMGFDCELKEVFSFIYTANLDHGLTENEYDHVFVGSYENSPVINPEEADGWKWIKLDELSKDIDAQPDRYTPWFKIAYARIKNMKII